MDLTLRTSSPLTEEEKNSLSLIKKVKREKKDFKSTLFNIQVKSTEIELVNTY